MIPDFITDLPSGPMKLDWSQNITFDYFLSELNPCVERVSADGLKPYLSFDETLLKFTFDQCEIKE